MRDDDATDRNSETDFSTRGALPAADDVPRLFRCMLTVKCIHPIMLPVNTFVCIVRRFRGLEIGNDKRQARALNRKNNRRNMQDQTCTEPLIPTIILNF